MTTEPLIDLFVLDLTRARAGPTAVRQLADWGADVVKIELPPSVGTDSLGGERGGFDFQNLHRNKRSLTLNLKSDQGRAVFFRLVEKADVVVENFRPDVKHRLGIDYDALSAVNPRLVYGSISGFGQEGPYSGRPGLDQIAQGMGGLMSVTGLPGQGPVRVGIPIADLSAGFNLAMGIMIALYERERSGKGQWVRTSLLEAQIAMMDLQAARYLMKGEVPQQAGNNHPVHIPTGVFRTEDGAIIIQASAQNLYRRMCDAIGAPALFDHPDFADPKDRLENRDRLNAEIEARTRTRSTQHWIDVLAEAGVPAGPIYSIDQTFADPQVKSLAMDPEVTAADGRTLRVVGQAVKMSRTPSRMRSGTPAIGAHTDEILRQAGYSKDEIQALRASGTV
ncbi:CaiB/BaiF CoA transferase family protein [Thalassobaculum litoreum]|uniref:Crotonobetainyl-CoA:carnitine CoA-transferase CaiB n=1 Tax=Thalassobaculum litoreum DSM 18839 TaxID=1123362 RepID=A0A8G2BNI5_9PROT|nr:CoA transferase [Thalassobaculum litoreum]SDG32796.1 Crotonobetainyl-CoA:carnitine CoA-transferase CaiB [Thalassobaculum litoreum DSM 18839]